MIIIQPNTMHTHFAVLYVFLIYKHNLSVIVAYNR